MNNNQQKKILDRFQEVLQYRLGLRLMAELADKLGEDREKFSERADSMSQEEVDKLVKNNFNDEQVQQFADEESQKIIEEISK